MTFLLSLLDCFSCYSQVNNMVIVRPIVLRRASIERALFLVDLFVCCHFFSPAAVSPFEPYPGARGDPYHRTSEYQANSYDEISLDEINNLIFLSSHASLSSHHNNFTSCADDICQLLVLPYGHFSSSPSSRLLTQVIRIFSLSP